MKTLIEKINTPLIETYTQTALNRVHWENWEEEDGTYTKLGDVYLNKLEWLKEHLLGSKFTTYEEGEDAELDEMLGIIDDLQETIVPILNELDKY